MLSDSLLWLLIVIYAAIMAASAYERRWDRFAYFLGAVVLTLGLLMSGRK